MRFAAGSPTVLLKTPFYWVLGAAVALISLYLALVWQADDTAHFGMSLLFIMAAGLLLWEKRKSLHFNAGIVDRLIGIALIGWVLWESRSITPDDYQRMLRFLPLISAFGIGLVASGSRGLKQYRQELTILFFLSVPSVLATFFADISPITAIFAAALLWSTGFDVSLQNVIVSLPGGSVRVFGGCSGMESMTYLLGIAVICLVMFPVSRTKQILLIGLAIATGFVVNGLRVALLAILSATQKDALFQYWHEGTGSLVFGMVAIGVFTIWFWLLSRSCTPQPILANTTIPLNITRADIATLNLDHMTKSTDSRSTTPEEKLPKLTNFLNQIWSSNLDLSQSVRPLHWIGYGLLLLNLFDLIEILIPPNFLDPSWELETYGAVVEQALLPLLGLGLIFLGGRQERPSWELNLLRVLSYTALLSGLLFFLLIPLGVFNTVRVDRLTNQQIDNQAGEKTAMLQQVQEQLDQVQSPTEFQALLQALGSESAPAVSSENLQQAKQQLTASMSANAEQLRSQVETTRSSQRLTLLKKSLKWNLGALITGALFITIWRGTRWARAAFD